MAFDVAVALPLGEQSCVERSDSFAVAVERIMPLISIINRVISKTKIAKQPSTTLVDLL